MAKYNRPNGKLFGSSATNIGVFGSGQQNETPATSTDPNTVNGLGTHWEEGWDGAVVSQAPYTAPYIEDMNAVNYVNSYNSAYLLQRGIPEYSATEEYQEDSVCTYNGEIWICLQDNTVGQTPAEGVYWHLQGEVPIMNDNEILVGAVGGTPTVVDTNAQGDILASASGLDIKANTIVNADVNASAGIEESKLALDYATATLNSDIGTVSGDLSTHTSNTSNPHSVTKAQVLSGDPIVNADVDASAGIEESKLALDYSTSSLNTAITTHTGDTANPHSTKIANLGDVVLSSPINDGDIIKYDLVSQKFVNSAPSGGALSTLSDVTITSPTDKQLVQYDYANSKWVNSSAVWDTIEVNDIAYVGTTPQGHTVDGSNNVTMLSTDNRHQVLTATDGYNIILPSTGIKAGEKFIFDFSAQSGSFNTPIAFYVGVNAYVYANTKYFRYEFLALADNPATNTDWNFVFTPYRTSIEWHGSNDYTVDSANANQRYSNSSSTIIQIPSGVYEGTLCASVLGGTINTANDWFFLARSGDYVITADDTHKLAIAGVQSFTHSSGTAFDINGYLVYPLQCPPYTAHVECYTNTLKLRNINFLVSFYSSTAGRVKTNTYITMKLIAPLYGSAHTV